MVGPPDSGSPSTTRSLLARRAIGAACALAEIDRGVRGQAGTWATRDAGQTLDGVVAVARPDGRYDVDLHLTARWPFGSLHELAVEVREDVLRAARAAGLGDALGQVSVAFEAVAAGSVTEGRPL
jgi:hypothetical protein